MLQVKSSRFRMFGNYYFSCTLRNALELGPNLGEKLDLASLFDKNSPLRKIFVYEPMKKQSELLESESSTCILGEYGEYQQSRAKLKFLISDSSKNLTFILKNSANNSIFASIFDSILDSGSSNLTSIFQFLESGPRFAKS